MKFLLFCVGFIWLLSGIGSLLVGPFVGIDRRRINVEAAEYWKRYRFFEFKGMIALLIFAFAYGGFLFPVIHPLLSAAVGLFFIILS